MHDSREALGLVNCAYKSIETIPIRVEEAGARRQYLAKAVWSYILSAL